MSLSPEIIQTVLESAPLVAQHANDISKKTYDILFTKYPDTKSFFTNASEDQHEKLALAISSYAANIDKLEVLDMVIDTIALAHAKAKVKPEHYPLVAFSFLHAMDEVLGDDGGETLLTAWKEAFLYLADILITKEKKLYAVVNL